MKWREATVKVLCMDKNATKFIDKWNGKDNPYENDRFSKEPCKIEIFDTEYGKRVLFSHNASAYEIAFDDAILAVSHRIHIFLQTQFLATLDVSYIVENERIEPITYMFHQSFTDDELDTLTEHELLYTNVLNMNHEAREKME
ncbi:hypothetical protein [Methanolobus tindarius]|nr:hypothetical protein [Methanolobus tindarius]